MVRIKTTEQILNGCRRIELSYQTNSKKSENIKCGDILPASNILILCNDCKSNLSGRLSKINDVLLKFLKIQEILNKYHSQLPIIEIGRQNALNDVDNEVELDKLISSLQSEKLKIEECLK